MSVHYNGWHQVMEVATACSRCVEDFVFFDRRLERTDMALRGWAMICTEFVGYRQDEDGIFVIHTA